MCEEILWFLELHLVSASVSLGRSFLVSVNLQGTTCCRLQFRGFGAPQCLYNPLTLAAHRWWNVMFITQISLF